MVYHTENFCNKKYNDILDLIKKSNIEHIEINCIMNKIKNMGSFNNFLLQIKKEDDVSIFNKFIKICDIDSKLFNLISDMVISEKYNYKEDYCTEYKLINIFQIRNTLNKWQDLTKSVFYDPKPGVKYHYKSIHSQYKRWCSNGIFKKAFHKCVPNNNDEEKLTGFKFNDDDDNFYIVNDNNDLFIDATSINNKYGSEGIVINPELKKKYNKNINNI